MKINEIMEGPYDPYRYKAIFFAGSPGSGKTYVARKLAGSFQGLKQVNMDIIFKHLMTRKNLSWKMPPEEEPEREKQRQRSKELVAKQQQTYADSGLGLLIDSTGRIYGTVEKIKNANTARNVQEIIMEDKVDGFFDEISKEACLQMRNHSDGNLSLIHI